MQSLEDITDLYKKHVAAAPNEVSPVYAQSIIVDIIDYFYQRAQKDKSNDNRRSTNSAEATCSTPCSNIFAAGNNTGDDNGLHFDYHYDNVAGDSPVQTPEDNGHHTDDHHDNVVGDRPVEAADVNVQHSDDHDDIVVGDFPDQGADDNGEHFDEQTDNVVGHSPVQVAQQNLSDVHVCTPSVDIAHCMSGETVIVPCSGGQTQSDQVYTGDTVKVATSSPDVSNQFKVSQGKIKLLVYFCWKIYLIFVLFMCISFHFKSEFVVCIQVVAKERRGVHVILRPMPLVIMLPPVLVHVRIPFHQMLQCQQLASQIILNL